MPRGITQCTGGQLSEAASMSLGIVLHQFQAIFVGQLANVLCIGASAIEMDNEDGACLRRDGLLDKLVINLPFSEMARMDAI